MRTWRRLRRFVRLWPGAYFAWPFRRPSAREVGWLLRDHYAPVIRAQLNDRSPLLRHLERHLERP